jgi:peptidoglycan/xylan/chitin deacetylase (PgdA/CDA1 family)
MNQIKIWADFIPCDQDENQPMTARQLQDLSNNKLFALGLHTDTHPSLAGHTIDIQHSEIVRCKDYLDKKRLAFVSAIAYPYGSCNNDTLLVVAQNNIALGFTTDPKVITNNSLSHRLGRFQINDFSGTELRYKLKNWLNQHSKHRYKSV